LTAHLRAWRPLRRSGRVNYSIIFPNRRYLVPVYQRLERETGEEFMNLNGATNGYVDHKIRVFQKYCHKGKALDYGCGTGGYTRRLAALGWEV
jgi:hypothetical protein